jgi:hypothetical protein
MRLLLGICLCALLLPWASPLGAYTIYLRDGSTIVADKEYELRNGNAIITLPGGTQTSLPIEEIDVPRTQAANQTDYGNAKVLDGVAQDDLTVDQRERKPTLSDLAATRGMVPRLDRRTERAHTDVSAEAEQPRTPAGYVDLARVRRNPFDNLDLAAQVSEFFRRQGVENLALFRGTQPRRMLLDITTNSEAAVFRALEVGANALLHVNEGSPNAIEAFEVVMATHRKQRAGQFLIDQERAGALVSKQIDLPHFFLRYVEY